MMFKLTISFKGSPNPTEPPVTAYFRDFHHVECPRYSGLPTSSLLTASFYMLFSSPGFPSQPYCICLIKISSPSVPASKAISSKDSHMILEEAGWRRNLHLHILLAFFFNSQSILFMSSTD